MEKEGAKQQATEVFSPDPGVEKTMIMRLISVGTGSLIVEFCGDDRSGLTRLSDVRKEDCLNSRLLARWRAYGGGVGHDCTGQLMANLLFMVVEAGAGRAPRAGAARRET